ncbi:MAG: zinc-dependent metalloprotease [Chitinophagaceae bacterium]
MKKSICLLGSALLMGWAAKAQISCGTDDLYRRLIKENPAISTTELALNEAIKNAIEAEKKYGSLFKTTAVSLDVPIVVHIIHDYGTDYLPDTVIFNAAAYWNKVYNKENEDTVDVLSNLKQYIGNPQINLHLATIDPNGNPTIGITRRQSYFADNGSDLAKMDYWPSTKYLNIWFIAKMSSDHSGAAAYAYYPSSAVYFPQYDGVIALASYVNTDKTITHEIGHTMNLAHTWGSTNNPGVACGDDDVDDTPPTYGHTSCLTSDLYDTRCATGYTDGSGIYHPNSTAAADTVNTQNIMDYSYCSKMFTIGQAARMRAALTSSVAGRNNLYSASNLAATGALAARPDLKPIPDFSIDKGLFTWGGSTTDRMVFSCEGSTTKFRFTNRSWNDTITGVTWAFSNGASVASSTSTGTIQNTFSTPGWVTVDMTATGNNTGTSTISRKAVYIASNTAVTNTYAQYFTGESDFANWPMFNYYGNNFKWEYSSTNGYPSGDGCIRFRSFDTRVNPERYSGIATGDFDDIYTPAFDLTTFAPGSSTLNLNFFTAGAATSGIASGDSMQVFASTTCGDTWVRIAVLKYADIINNGVQTAEFAPTSVSNWKAQTVAIPAAQRTDKTFFRFRYWPAVGGNNMYMDNFTISPWTTEIKEVAANASDVKLYPNPSNGSTKLYFTLSQSGEATYAIRDIAGKVIFQKNITGSANSFVTEDIDRSIFPAAGVYLVTLTQSEQTNTQKLVIQ